MFRRTRFSVRPNVGTSGRTAATPSQEAALGNQEERETPKDVTVSQSVDGTDNNSDSTPPEKTTVSG